MTYGEFFRDIGTDLGVPAETVNIILANMQLEIGIRPEDTIEGTPKQIATMRAGYAAHLRHMLGQIRAGNVAAVDREIKRCEDLIEAKLRRN